MSTEHLPVVFLLSCTPIPMKPHTSTGRSSLAPSSHACCLAACTLRYCCLGPRMPQRSLSYPPNACLVENPKTLESKFHARALVALGVWQAVGVWHKLPVGGAGHTHAQEHSHQAASRGWRRTPACSCFGAYTRRCYGALQKCRRHIGRAHCPPAHLYVDTSKKPVVSGIVSFMESSTVRWSANVKGTKRSPDSRITASTRKVSRVSLQQQAAGACAAGAG